tara:strand:+ start:3961 stop:5571 length:1611 start_codon:yes stop_codon:yes gene_type:complete
VNQSLKNLIRDLPTNAGIYQMLDQFGTIIYIGKAKNIKKRVAQYFIGNNDYKTSCLVKHIHSIAPIITKSEHAALLLENQLIKQHQPRYNILLKDDKTYPYIKITVNEPYPKLMITRVRKNDGARYFGPYTSYGSTKRLKQLLVDVFTIRDCKQDIDTVTLQKKCLKLDIGKCIGPCIYKHLHDEYNHLIQQCIEFLEGKSQSILTALKDQMKIESANQAYEKAATYRDKIKTLESIQQQRQLEFETNQHYFVIGCSNNEHFHYLICQHFSKKLLISQHGHYAPIDTSFDVFIHCFFEELIASIPKVSNLIIDASMAEILSTALKNTPKKISVITPQKGKYLELLTIANLNAQKSLIGISKASIQSHVTSPLELLKKDLGLSNEPRIIFGCDISHYYGTQIVSSVVVFIDGKPAKKWYRHFHIKSITTGKSDDVKSMKETVARLLEHFDITPDLLLIDGGKAQLNAALQSLKDHQKDDIFCIGLAKKHEEIFTPFQSTPIQLPYHHSGLNLLRFVRDEAHRFALNFQRRQRKRNLN